MRHTRKALYIRISIDNNNNNNNKHGIAHVHEKTFPFISVSVTFHIFFFSREQFSKKKKTSYSLRQSVFSLFHSAFRVLSIFRPSYYFFLLLLFALNFFVVVLVTYFNISLSAYSTTNRVLGILFFIFLPSARKCSGGRRGGRWHSLSREKRRTEQERERGGWEAHVGHDRADTSCETGIDQNRVNKFSAVQQSGEREREKSRANVWLKYREYCAVWFSSITTTTSQQGAY